MTRKKNSKSKMPWKISNSSLLSKLIDKCRMFDIINWDNEQLTSQPKHNQVLVPFFLTQCQYRYFEFDITASSVSDIEWRWFPMQRITKIQIYTKINVVIVVQGKLHGLWDPCGVSQRVPHRPEKPFTIKNKPYYWDVYINP